MKKYLSLLSSILITISISSCNSGSSSSSNSSRASITSATNATSKNWIYSYTPTGELATVTDPLGGVTSYTYDASDNLSKITDPLGHVTQLKSYNSMGNPRLIVDQNGVNTGLAYTIDGYLASSTTAGYKTSYEYDAAGDLIKVTNPDGSFIGYTYDDARRIVAMNNSVGSIKFTLDAAGNHLSQQINDPGGSAVFSETMAYDELSRILKIIDANGAQNFAYDAVGNLASAQDGRGNSTSYTWDALNRVTQITDAKGGTTKYAYGSSERPTSIRDAKGSLTNYSYNGLDNMTEQISPDSGTTHFTTYDAAGNLTTQLDANGQTISYNYDLLSRPTSISYGADANQNINLVYDSGSYAIGKLSQISNALSSISYGYNNHGDMINEVQTIDGQNYALAYTYTKAGQAKNITYPNGVKVYFDYANDGQIYRVRTNKVIATISRLPFGPIKSIAYSNKLTENLDYNANYQVTQQTLGTLLNNSYSYYPNGDIQSISGMGSFDYNPLRQLTSVTSNSMTNQYDYDAVGNRNGETINGNNTSYTIAENGNRLLASNGAAYSYDNNGNLLQSGALNYHYDSINRPDIVSDGSGVIAKYGYNPLSQRVIKEINGKKTIYIYDETGELLSEIDGNSGQTIRNYVWLDGAPIAILEGNNIYYIHDDHNGTPLLVTDKKGAIVWQATYDAFGKASITTEKITLNLRFAGQYYDDETKLHYNWHRYYDPSIGRYISSDPM